MSDDDFSMPERDLKTALSKIEGRILSLRKEIQELERKRTAIFTLLDIPHALSMSPPTQLKSNFTPSPSFSLPSFPAPTPNFTSPQLPRRKATPEDILKFADRYYKEIGPFTTGELAKVMQANGFYLGDARPDIRVWSIVKGVYKRNKQNRYEKIGLNAN